MDLNFPLAHREKTNPEVPSLNAPDSGLGCPQQLPPGRQEGPRGWHGPLPPRHAAASPRLVVPRPRTTVSGNEGSVHSFSWRRTRCGSSQQETPFVGATPHWRALDLLPFTPIEFVFHSEHLQFWDLTVKEFFKETHWARQRCGEGNASDHYK